ncbi:MAG: hypothetical protein IJF07_00030 [Lachnospiraceae bacterium]|nr:hypothetical protein [Lachnospiraceae bacterium]
MSASIQSLRGSRKGVYDNDYESVCGESFIITDIHYDPVTNLIAYGGCF